MIEQGKSSEALPDSIAVSLLVAMLGDEVLPAELLAARVVAPDGLAWASNVLAAMPPANADLYAWNDVKRESKRAFSRRELAEGNDRALAAFLGYLAAIAGAWCSHGVSITEMDSDQVVRALELVGAHLPSPWRECFSQARQRASGAAR